MSGEKKDEKPPAPPADAKKEGDAKGDAKGEAKADAKAEAKAPAAGGSPWLPVLVVIVILPVLSFIVTEMVMIPRVKKALAEVAVVQKEGEQPAHGGPMPTEKKETKKKAEKGGHGGGGHGGGGHGKEAEGGKEIVFENVVANLSGAMKTRFVKVSFSLEGEGDDFGDVIKENKTKLIDSALSILGALTVAELDEPGVKNIIRSDLINSFNQVLGTPIVKGLYFSEFVIQ